MNEPVVKVPTGTEAKLEALSLDKFAAIAWESAISAFVRSILIIVFGSIAVGMVSGVWREMAPSVPPGFGSKPEAEATSGRERSSWRPSLGNHGFRVVFCVVFIPTLCGRLAGLGGTDYSKGAKRIERVGKQLSERWFGLVVGNAIGAMISAIALNWVQQFAPARLLFGWLMEALWAGVQGLVHDLLGADRGDTVVAWFKWYGENQLKFSFWFFYLAAICDDLGIPNLKTLIRWLVRRLRNRTRTVMRNG